MRKIIFILFTLLNLSTYSQLNDTLHHSKFDVGISFSPDYSYRVLKTGAENNWMKDIYDTLEVGRYTYTGGVSLYYQPDEKVSISFGILISDKGEKTKNYTLQPVNNYINHYYYLDIPLRANYYLVHKKIKLFLSAGVCTNIYIKGHTRSQIGISGETKKFETAPGIVPVAFSFIGGLGIDCPLTDRWYFKLEPNYRRFITPATNSAIKKYFYSAGLNLGLFHKL